MAMTGLLTEQSFASVGELDALNASSETAVPPKLKVEETVSYGELCPIQEKLFKRRRRATAALTGDVGSALAPRCCDRCKSDLNGKLMVRCATCTFRRHLYCFTPPLRQHPAFLLRKKQQQQQMVSPASQESGGVSPSCWKCEKCQGDAVVFNTKIRPSSVTRMSTFKAARSLEHKARLNAVLTHPDPLLQRCSQDHGDEENPPSSALDEKDKTAGWSQIVQPQWLENSEVVFDWYTFRAEKTKAVRDSNKTGTRDADLVFYSKSYALMKKTARLWLTHVQRQCHFRQQRDQELLSMRYPAPKRNVNHSLSAEDELKLEQTRLRLQEEEEEEDWLFDDSEHYEFKPITRRPPRLPLLWRGDAPSALMCWTTHERLEIWSLLEEMQERVALGDEDMDASGGDCDQFPDATDTIGATTEAEEGIEDAGDPGELTAAHPSLLGLHLAAKIIQRVFVQHQRRLRRAYRLSRQRRTAEEIARRAKARSSLSIVRLCVQFVMLMLKKLEEAQMKKALVLVMHDAAEETQVTTACSVPTARTNEAREVVTAKLQHRKQLSEIRIGRFFLRRVRPYVQLKKQVMARRLQRWWKHVLLPYKWREVARAALLTRRTNACTRIQRLYRQARAQEKFRMLIEKHALQKLQLLLRGWMFSRLAKKERYRCTVNELARSLCVVGDGIVIQASVEETLEQLGLRFYQTGDFWNAAAMLERLWELKKGRIARELQMALAYAHHMAWYTSYDQFNLSRSHELYCATLDAEAGKAKVDPLVLQDLAVVMMQMERFGASLRLLAKLIELFARMPELRLWLLLASVQLQQRGEWEQSVVYLTYLHDIPPEPYQERDILALCAMGYERMAALATAQAERETNSGFAKEAWRAALRLWNREEVSSSWSYRVPGVGNGRVVTCRQRWQLLTSFAERALAQGHYLLAQRVYLYALERQERAMRSGSGDTPSLHTYCYEQERRTAWWNLADAFRHLGHLELYLDATRRSRGVNLELQDATAAAEEEASVESWRADANKQASSFQDELQRLPLLEKLQQLCRNDQAPR